MYRRVYLGEMAWEQLPARLESTVQDDGTVLLQTLTPRILEGDLDAPRTLLLSGDISHRLQSGWMFRARASHRTTRDNIIVDRSDGEGVVVDPAALAIGPVPFPTDGREGGFLDLSNQGSADSWSLELTAAKRIPTGGEFVFSYVRSSSFGDLNDFTLMTSEFPSPIIRPNERGDRRFDAPHRIIAWGTIEAPFDVLITPAVEWRSGFPFSRLAENQSYLGDPNTERFPNFFALDLQATKAIEIKGYRITGGVKLSNLTGHDNPRQVIANTADPRFGTFLNSVPFKLRAKFNVRF